MGKGFCANPMRARNKETEGQGFYINSKKKKIESASRSDSKAIENS